MRTSLAAILLIFSCKILPAQTNPSAAQVAELKSMVTTQQKALERQQSQIEALAKALAEQKALLEQALEKNGEDRPELVSATYHSSSETGSATRTENT